MKDRIIEVMNLEGLSPSRFAEEIGIQRAAMSHITSGRNNPSLDVLTKILERYNYINPDWLLFGIGNMKRDQIPVNDYYVEKKQPDLFAYPLDIQQEKKNITEYRMENTPKKPVVEYKQTKNEMVRSQKTEQKRVVKIMIFYSDNTYETFNPEK